MQAKVFDVNCLPRTNFYTVKLRKHDIQVFQRYYSKEKKLQSQSLLTLQLAGVIRYLRERFNFGMLSTCCLMSGSYASGTAFQWST